MQSITSLQKLGLSETEAAIYLFLTQNGPSSGPQVQSALDLDKVPAYRALNALSSRNFILTTGDKRRQRYIAQPADKLLNQYDHLIDDLRHAKSDMQAFVDALADQNNQLYKDRKIQVYEGIEGYRLWMNERLRTDVKVVRQIANSNFWEPFLGKKDKVMDFATPRVAKGIELRSIFTSRDNPKHSVTTPSNLKYTRYLALPTTPTINLSTFGSRVGYYSNENNSPRGVIIDDKLLATLLTTIFDLLWEQSEQI